MSTETRKLIETTKRIAKEFGVKFCTACNLTKPVEGGKVKLLSNGRSRWLCAVCAAKGKPSGFMFKKAG